VGETGDLVLTSADGTQFAAYYAHPAESSGTAMVILPDVRGLHSFYKELAVRFAEAGMHAIAFDYFGRTAGLGSRDEEFPYREHIEKLEPSSVTEDVAASAGWLREHSSAGSVFSVGFCFGGSGSWRQSAAGLDLAGCVGFYGIPSRAEGVVDEMRAPLLMLAAGQDFTRWRPCRSSPTGCGRRAWRPRCTSTRTRRTASSTGRSASTATLAPTRGCASSTSSPGTRPDARVGVVSGVSSRLRLGVRLFRPAGRAGPGR
jgi:carboxymethylenebutenolidase